MSSRFEGGRWAWLPLLCVLALLAGSACSGGGGDDDGGGGSEVSAGSGEEDVEVDDGKRRILDTGTDGPATAGEIVATSAAEWQEKWSSSGATTTAPNVGDVDFEREVVVGLFAGEKPTGGWQVSQDVDVKIQGRFASVNYVVVGPGEGCQSTQALTSPYLVAAVRATSVRFTATERKDDCE